MRSCGTHPWAILQQMPKIFILECENHWFNIYSCILRGNELCYGGLTWYNSVRTCQSQEIKIWFSLELSGSYPRGKLHNSPCLIIKIQLSLKVHEHETTMSIKVYGTVNHLKFNILVPEQHGHLLADIIFKLIFLYENCFIWIKIPKI